MDVDFGDTIVRTDQPEYAGGEGSAATPFQHFLTSIAACVGYYALAFCDSRDISTEGMELEMVSEIDADKRMYVKMSFELRLPPGFPERYHGAIRAAMSACSVKKHMDEPPIFEAVILPAEGRPAEGSR